MQQAKVTEEITQGLHNSMMELFTLLQTAPLAAVPFPILSKKMTQLLSKLTVDDDVEAAPRTFEGVAQWKGWPERDWTKEGNFGQKQKQEVKIPLEPGTNDGCTTAAITTTPGSLL